MNTDNLSFLVPQLPPRTPSRRYGVVLRDGRIKLDGEPVTAAVTPTESLIALYVGLRVCVRFERMRAIVEGVDTSTTLNSAPEEEPEKPKESIGLAAYPVGAFYWSANPTDPEELFGGRWRRIEDVFLYAASWRHGAGETGGEEKHILSLDEIPAHRHRVGTTHGSAGYGGVGWYQSNVGGGNGWFVATTSGSGAPGTMVTEIKGGGAPHNNMPPFLAAYCWQRIA